MENKRHELLGQISQKINKLKSLWEQHGWTINSGDDIPFSNVHVGENDAYITSITEDLKYIRLMISDCYDYIEVEYLSEKTLDKILQHIQITLDNPEDYIDYFEESDVDLDEPECAEKNKFNNLKIYCVGRGEGPVVICQELPTKDPWSDDEDAEDFDITSTDWLYKDVENGTGSIAVASWNDEYIWAAILDGVNSEQELHDQFIQEVDEWLKNNGPLMDDDEIYIDLKCGICVDICADYFNKVDRKNPEKIWEAWICQYNESFVDGDSSSCECLVDLNTGDLIAGGYNIDVQL